jgi:glycosyltransferase involved in cell wall biosynthesis
MRAAATQNPFVSVVTVSLNAAASIEDTIASVAGQQAEFAVEHICVDGGSTDGTRSIIDDWAARLNHIRHIYESDSGIFDAMNKGLRVARGEYVLFLNADDFLVAPNTLAIAMRGLVPESATNPDLVVGNVHMGMPGTRGVWRRRDVPSLLGRLRRCGLYPPHQGMFARRDVLDSVGGFDSRCRFAADIIQYYDLDRRPKLSLRRIDTCVAFMRAGGAANSGLGAVYGGSAEIYLHLRPLVGTVKAATMVLVKSLQSMVELRYGIPTAHRWFAS